METAAPQTGSRRFLNLVLEVAVLNYLLIWSHGCMQKYTSENNWSALDGRQFTEFENV